ncbi:MAG: PHP domain-containing protein [Candidatus Xenobia bacterium]
MDFHLHTTVSDGLMTPLQVLEQSARVGSKHVSITDHDAVGAYRDPELMPKAKELGMELTVGIELDVADGELEMHVLGIGINANDPQLLGHLRTVQRQRRQRAEEQLVLINELLGEGTVTVSEALPDAVDTVMKPHIVRALLARDRFATYAEAKAWMKANVHSTVHVTRPTVIEGIELLKQAGGIAVLAHPGYYMRETNLQITPYLAKLKEMGLDGVEVHYPYALHDPRLFSAEQMAALRDELLETAKRLGLQTTRGSDCHKAEDFAKVYGAAVPAW